ERAQPGPARLLAQLARALGLAGPRGAAPAALRGLRLDDGRPAGLELVVLLDRLREPGGAAPLREQAGLEVRAKDEQLAVGCLARAAARLREAIPRAGEADEVGAAAVAVGGEHRAHAAGAVRVRADDDVVLADPAQHREPGVHRQAVDCQPERL